MFGGGYPCLMGTIGVNCEGGGERKDEGQKESC